MKYLILLFLTLSTLAAPLTPKDLAGKRILFLGDSITAAGSYVSMTLYELLRQNPEADFDVVCIGLGSETASCLSEADHPFPRPCIHERLERALAAVKPDVVFACYGMNDGIYHPPSADRQVAYEDGIQMLIDKAKAAGVEHIVLLTPGTFDPVPVASKVRREPPEKGYSYKFPFADYNDVLANFAKWILAVEQPGVHSVDLHQPMADFVATQRKANPGYTLARDGIHPQAIGHLVMAQSILAALGVQPEADRDAALARTHADPLYTLVDRYRKARSKAWLSYVGYTRGKTVKTDSIDAAEATARTQMQAINALRRR
ncbi:MAG: lysophospholipase L1-like esterase [Rhodothermales bacterium]|jgi:lysophospholipase L1-like esterase